MRRIGAVISLPPPYARSTLRFSCGVENVLSVRRHANRAGVARRAAAVNAAVPMVTMLLLLLLLLLLLDRLATREVHFALQMLELLELGLLVGDETDVLLDASDCLEVRRSRRVGSAGSEVGTRRGRIGRTRSRGRRRLDGGRLRHSGAQLLDLALEHVDALREIVLSGIAALQHLRRLGRLRRRRRGGDAGVGKVNHLGGNRIKRLLRCIVVVVRLGDLVGVALEVVKLLGQCDTDRHEAGVVARRRHHIVVAATGRSGCR
jgi:hypothetical protein